MSMNLPLHTQTHTDTHNGNGSSDWGHDETCEPHPRTCSSSFIWWLVCVIFRSQQQQQPVVELYVHHLECGCFEMWTLFQPTISALYTDAHTHFDIRSSCRLLEWDAVSFLSSVSFVKPLQKTPWVTHILRELKSTRRWNMDIERGDERVETRDEMLLPKSPRILEWRQKHPSIDGDGWILNDQRGTTKTWDKHLRWWFVSCRGRVILPEYCGESKLRQGDILPK